MEVNKDGVNNGEVIKEALIAFICDKCEATDKEDIIGALDDIIINYVVTVLEDAVDLKKRQKKDDFDLEEFSEMISAYFPTFGDIPAEEVREWVDELVRKIITEDDEMNSAEDIHDKFAKALLTPQGEQEVALLSQKLSSVLNLIPNKRVTSTGSSQSRTSSMSTEYGGDDDLFSFEHEQGSGGAGRRVRSISSCSSSSTSNEIQTLAEMFPNYKPQDLNAVLSLANNDVEKAVQILLLDESMLDGVVGGGGGMGKKKKGFGLEMNNKGRGNEEDFRKGLKDRLVARYGFVDQSQDKKEHRPILPKEEPKKLLRYRNGQVVSTKGERFTEVQVTSTGEEVKIRSYLSRSQRQAMAEGRMPN